MSRKAIVLFNLGGPSSLEEVRPFLFNLFYDKAIINLINPFRYLVARFIAGNRETKAKEIYSKIGGSSPILKETLEQAKILQERINKVSMDCEYKVFVSMRYSKPGALEVIKEIMSGGYGEILLIPLYPQFSSTTTESSITEFMGLLPKYYTGKVKALCCYFQNDDFINSHIELIRKSLKKIKQTKIRILFSAHSLPEKIIKKGDPYEWQIKSTCQKIMADNALLGVDYRICYQSKVGKLKWLEPSTEEEIIKAANDKVSILLVPISFVSEHSETQVELDIDYKALASEYNIAGFYRVPTLGINDSFIDCLVNFGEFLSNKEIEGQFAIYTADKSVTCPGEFCYCALRRKNEYSKLL